MLLTLRTTKHPSDGPPIHIVTVAGAKHRLCGQRDLLPVVLARAAGAHARGYNPLFCGDCVAALTEMRQ